MDQDLATYLADLQASAVSPEAKALAASMAARWKRGIVPSRRELDLLSRLTAPPPSCSRMERDGACAWLRRHGVPLGLQVPPVGERALCCYPSEQLRCPGFRRPRRNG